MKRRFIILGATLLAAIFVLAACTPVLWEGKQYLGGSATAEGTLIEDVSDLLVSAPKTLTLTGPTYGTPVNTTGQIITMDFNYMIDSATVPTSIFFYSLSNAQPYQRSTRSPNSLEYTFQIVQVAGACRVIFTVNMSTATNPSECYVNAATLAGLGNERLDRDGDDILAEAEDSYYATFAVGTAAAIGWSAPTVVAPAVVASPTALVTYTPQNLLAAGSAVIDWTTFDDPGFTLDFDLIDTGSAAQPTSVDHANTVAVYRWVSGAWVADPPTYNTAATTATEKNVQIVIATTPVRDSYYKIVLDKYNMIETDAVRGFRHRAANDADDPATRYETYYYYFHNAGAAQQAFSGIAVGGDTGEKYIEFNVPPAGTPINISTITPANVKIRLGQGTALASGMTMPSGGLLVDYPASSVVQMSSDTFEHIDTACYRFRIYLPSWVRTFSEATYHTQILVSPSVMSRDNDAQDGDGRLSYGDVSNNADDGWARYDGFF